MTSHTSRGRRGVAGAILAGAVTVGMLITPAAAHADILDDLDAQYDIGSSGGDLSNLLRTALKLRAQGFGPSKGNLDDIQAALDQRPNQVPLIHALQDTVKFQKRNQARAAGARPQSPIVIGGPGGLPPGLVPGTGGSQIPLGG
ncbi:hypothetical protein A5630_18290 [Mycolicibacterium mucogenicum]|uniref:Uncharacterized protein n=2 Tax=Mycolicibacterium mucogenicum TaxID=56689 RepID=A0A8H2JCZ8_MYCMU|nr:MULTISPECIES: hypothetical protein [Mycobacteriaceae]KAB7753204.1 hypothetical protein MMUC44124_25725 [Mycolicibacterium mucogenicum DSM 44124]OBJ43609.1 hypothetical protein A5630_18290 [Mycolicibacterium mucogenicum]QPG67180.1 hypothetical protein C1S78_016490 [Mycolicibacterium mucogenicum DSM 44124]SEB27012.1 hypothetical protein SAMN04488580_12455 [Mycobacterium sp. 283mftsu]